MPIWLLIWLNLGIYGSERDTNPKPLLCKRNGRIYGIKHDFRVVPLFVFKIMAKMPIGLNLGILGCEREKNPKLLSWKWNDRINGCRA